MGQIVYADYKTLEMRIAAHVWRDPAFTKAVLSEDVHAAVGRSMFGADYDDPEKQEELRVLAKNVGFGNLFGSEGYAVAEQTGLPLRQIQDYIAVFRQRFPGLIDAMEATKREAIDPGWVTSITGRERRFFLPKQPELQRSPRVKAELREAVNYVVQGPAAEITLLAMREVHGWIKQNELKSLVVSNIHDAILMDVPEDELDLIIKEIPEIIEHPPTEETWDFSLDIPLQVDVKWGPSWGELQEVKA